MPTLPLGFKMCRFQSYNVHVVDAALVVSGYKAGPTSNYWTNCTLAIATGFAPSSDRTNSIVLYRVQQRLRQFPDSDTSNVMVEKFLPSVGHHVVWLQVCHQNKSQTNIQTYKTNNTIEQLRAFQAMLLKQCSNLIGVVVNFNAIHRSNK